MRVFRLLLGLLLPLLAGSAIWRWTRPPEARPSVLLITVDTLRRDHLGLYGYHRATSPVLDLLAETGVVLDSAFANATLTGPAHATIMTSLYPPTHRVVNNAIPLGDDYVTLAEVLQAAGYHTAMFVSYPFVGTEFGFGQGFEHSEHHYLPTHGNDHPHPDEEEGERGATDAVFRALSAWLDERPGTFFAWLHVQHPHVSYEPPPPYDRRFGEPPASRGRDLRCMDVLAQHADGSITLEGEEIEYAIALYDGEIAYVDAQIGEVLRHVPDGTLVVLTADHGEVLFDDPDRRQSGHGRHRTDSVLRIPLVFSGGPVQELGQRRVAAMVEQVDIAPTIVELLDITPPGSWRGASLAGLMAGETTVIRQETHSCTIHTDGRLRGSVRDARFRMLWNADQDGGEVWLHDLESDPGQALNVAGDPARVDDLRRLSRSMTDWFVAAAGRDGIREAKRTGRDARELLRRGGYLRDEEEAEPGSPRTRPLPSTLTSEPVERE